MEAKPAAHASNTAPAGALQSDTAPSELAPYGEASLSAALTDAPNRLRKRMLEADPFGEGFLVPAAAARRLKLALDSLESVLVVGDRATADDEAEVGVVNAQKRVSGQAAG